MLTKQSASIRFSFVLVFLLCSTNLGNANEILDKDDKQRYRDSVFECLNNLVAHGRDRYGPHQSAMFASVIDTRIGEAPAAPEVYDSLIRTEGRLHRRNPGGADLWEDQPLLRTLFSASRLSGDQRYAEAANDYIKIYFERSVKDNGLLVWGTHIYYDMFTDAPAGDQDGLGPHEILILSPDWQAMWRVAPESVRRQIELMWEWHIVDKQSGLFNRHDDKQVGCDFAFFGGELVYAFAFLSSIDGDKTYLDRAKLVASRHWNARNPDTNLAPDAPSTGDRYDAHHSFTTLPGPHAALLLKAYEVTGETIFRDYALAYIEAYTLYGWDEDAGRFHAMLALDGTPTMNQEKGDGYDRWKPTGYVDTWRTTMFSYEFPLISAQTAVYAYRVTRNPLALDAAEHWAQHIRSDLPVQLGRRWKAELIEAIPALENIQSSYAENYGRAISFFLSMYYETEDESYLTDAKSIADDALKLLYKNGWFTGLPAKPLYETVDGVPALLYALLELSSFPERLDPNL